MANAANKSKFRVEAHGTGILAMRGGVLRSFGYTQEPLLTREGAWELVKGYMADGPRYHTVKVYSDGGKLVFRACRLEDGSWCNIHTGLPVNVKVAA